MSGCIGDFASDSIRADDGVLVDLLINHYGNSGNLLDQHNDLRDELA